MVYLIFLTILFILYFIDKLFNRTNKKSPLLKVAFIIVFLFSALRFNVGWDYKAYYDTIAKGLQTNIIANNELLTIGLIKVAIYFKMPIIYFITNSLITIGFIYLYIVRESKNYWQSLLLFVLFPLFYLNSFSVIRIFSAIAIVMYSLKYVEKRSFIFIFLVFIAMMFHMSAVISLVYLFFKKINILQKKYLLPFVLFIFLTPKIIYFVVTKYLPKYSSYVLDTQVKEGTKAIYMIGFVAIILFIVRKKIAKNRKNIINNGFLFGFLLYITFISKGTIGHRLSLFFTMNFITILPSIIEIFNDRIIKKSMYFALQTIMIASFVWTIYNGSETYLPYKIYEVIKIEN